MFDTENPQSQQFPYVSTSPTTPSQFIDILRLFFEENNVTNIGPFRMGFQHMEESGRNVSKMVLLLEGEIRSAGLPNHHQSASTSVNMSPSNFGSDGTWEEARRNTHLSVLESDSMFGLNYSQVNSSSPNSESVLPSNSPSAANTCDPLDFSDLPSSNNHMYPLPSTASDFLPRGSNKSLHSRQISSTSSSELEGNSYRQSLEQSSLGMSVSLDENVTASMESSMLFDNNIDVPYIHSSLTMSTIVCPCELPKNSQNGPQTSNTQKTNGSVSVSDGLGTRDLQVPLPSVANSIIISASQNILREDYIQLLETELPRWKIHGLWQETQSQNLTTGMSGYKELELAYSSVCQLDVRMSDDAIRKRMALIRLHSEYTKTYQTWKAQQQRRSDQSTTIGRGDATLIIDSILESVHDGWNSLNHRRRSELRAKFHDRKRYGKRWLLLADTLGPSILLLCSSIVANMIRNTAVTAKMLEAMTLRVKTDHLDIMSILQKVNSFAGCLCHNEGYTSYDVDEILKQVQSVSLRPSSNEKNSTVP